MTAIELSKALAAYDVQKRRLEPSRYEAGRSFRSQLPELYPERTMGPPPGDGGEPGGPGGPGAMDFMAMMAREALQGKLMTALLSGAPVDEGTMQRVFGFTYGELKAAMEDLNPVKKPIPKGLVLMTFDDSTIDHYEVACPVLEKYGGKAVLFTTEMEHPMDGGPGFEDKTRFMTWEQIRELSDRGHEIANHSWHHRNDLIRQDDETILREIRTIDERCAQYGIPRPITFGYPGGGATKHVAELLRAEGYRWGRGELQGPERELLGSAPYDPYLDTPMVVPNVMASDGARVKELIDATEGGKVLLMVEHEVVGPGAMGMPYEDLIAAIYDCGGRCITFRDLEEYVDPEKAYAYTN